MSTEENKVLIRRFYEEVFNTKNLNALDEFCSSDFVDYNPAQGQAPGREGVKQIFAAYTAAFPDLTATVEDQIAEGDKVVVRMSVRGTHRGELMGIAPTEKQITVSGIDIFRIVSGKVVERWGNTDELGMMQQLGVIPVPGQT